MKYFLFLFSLFLISCNVTKDVADDLYYYPEKSEQMIVYINVPSSSFWLFPTYTFSSYRFYDYYSFYYPYYPYYTRCAPYSFYNPVIRNTIRYKERKVRAPYRGPRKTEITPRKRPNPFPGYIRPSRTNKPARSSYEPNTGTVRTTRTQTNIRNNGGNNKINMRSERPARVVRHSRTH